METTKLDLAPLRPQAARGFRYLEVPKLLLENSSYAPLDEGAKFLYCFMLERAGLSAQNAGKFMDGNGRFFIIYTVEQMQKQGIVGPSEGAKPRQVLITRAQWQERQMGSTPESGGEAPWDEE